MQKVSVQPNSAARHVLAQQAAAAAVAFAAGDYKAARQMYQQLAQTSPDSEIGQQARQRAALLRTDPAAVAAGFAAMLLVALASLWARGGGAP